MFPYRPPRPRSRNATIKTLKQADESVSGVLLGKLESKAGGAERIAYPDGRLPNPATRPTSPTSSSSPGPLDAPQPHPPTRPPALQLGQPCAECGVPLL